MEHRVAGRRAWPSELRRKKFFWAATRAPYRTWVVFGPCSACGPLTGCCHFLWWPPPARVFDLRRMRVRHTVPNAHRKPVKALAIDVGRRAVASGSNDGAVKVRDAEHPRHTETEACGLGNRTIPAPRLQVWSLDGSSTTGDVEQGTDMALVSHLPDVHPEKSFINHRLAGSMVRCAGNPGAAVVHSRVLVSHRVCAVGVLDCRR